MKPGYDAAGCNPANKSRQGKEEGPSFEDPSIHQDVEEGQAREKDPCRGDDKLGEPPLQKGLQNVFVPVCPIATLLCELCGHLATECSGQKAGSGALVGVLCQATLDDPSERRRTGDLEIRERRRFVVEDGGEFLYTRNGSFQVDDTGRLITSNGAVVMDEQDQPIVFSPDEANIDISRDGVVRTDNGEIATLRIVTFVNQQDMEHRGSSMFYTEQVPIEAADTEVVQGMLEGSNVVAITEMTRMIQILRSYQSAAQLITQEEDRETEAIDILTRTV